MNKILITGASGFIGANIKSELESLSILETLGLNQSNNINCNVARSMPKFQSRYDIVLHAAGKAHVVPKSKEEAQAFFDVNLQGTINLCKGLEKVGVPKAFIFVSTVAVYGCENGENIDESHPLNGSSPYALSKRRAEEFLMEWAKNHGVILSIIRPSLIAGPNPPGNLGAMIQGIKTGRYLSIAGGRARKSVLMVQDLANLVPLLAEKGGIYNVCDSEQPTFRDLELTIAQQLGKSQPMNIPYSVAKGLALIGDCMGKFAPINSSKLSKITNSLTFSNEKARRELGWEPLDVLTHFKIQ